MTRIAVLGISAGDRAACAARVRGATLFAGNDSADALAVLRWDSESNGLVESYLTAGKPLLLVASAGAPESEMRRLIAANSANLAVANPDRYRPSRALIRQQIDAGKLGAPGLIRIHGWRPAGGSDSSLCVLDLATWYFGLLPDLVYAIPSGASGIQIHLRFPGNGAALICRFHELPSETDYDAVMVIGSNGAAYADDHQNQQTLYTGGVAHALRSDEGLFATTALIQEFARGDSRPAEMNAKHWRSIIAIRDAVDRSLKSRQAERLDDWSPA